MSPPRTRRISMTNRCVNDSVRSLVLWRALFLLFDVCLRFVHQPRLLFSQDCTLFASALHRFHLCRGNLKILGHADLISPAICNEWDRF